MNYINLDRILALHNHIIQTSGGSAGVRDLGGLESAIAQPHMTFGGQDLYPTVIEKAAALCFSLIQNHPFVDGNKRVGHAAMASILAFNGYRIDAIDRRYSRADHFGRRIRRSFPRATCRMVERAYLLGNYIRNCRN